ncbi:fructuronate reductase [Klenkia marina]|uniref:Fructuronate reductase n=1 Tax=Klenkia marina TaxID=1960309 RepID=A0A1G4XTA3_9ACTN|nr:mannitol dehydrogenase family protein [Klenkia marina]SCX44433.1 fructuronate reductase [Klenkia marina]
MSAPGTPLCRAALPTLPARTRPLVDPADLRPGTAHLGYGAFHRAHQAVYTERAAQLTGRPAGTVVVVPRSAATAAALRAQDGLCSVGEVGPEGTTTRVVAAVADVVLATEEPERRDAVLADPAVATLTLTITEAGYSRRADGGLDTADPAIAADLAGGPVSAVGTVARALAVRARGCAAPVAVVSCDNLAGNGPATRRVVTDFVAASRWADADAVLAWIDDAVTFPSTLVDQIVPAATDEVRRAAAAELGVVDELAVVAEPWRQWVVEDAFPGPRPAWHLAGAQLVPDVAPFQLTKLRLLNGAHSLLAYTGLAAGCTTVADVLATTWGADLVRGLAAEVAPTLPAGGPDPAGYAEALVGRFANPGTRHRLAQIGGDGSAKARERWFAPLRELRTAGRPAPVLETALAAWANATRPAAGGQLFGTTDPAAADLASCWRPQRPTADVVAALLRVAGAPDLADDADLTASVAHRLPAVAAGRVDP